MKKGTGKNALFSLIISVLLVPAAFADDIELALAIDAVTVYLSGAEVTRAASVNLPAGDHRLIIANLPAGIDPARLTLRIDHPAVRLGSLQLEEVHQGELVSAEEQVLQTELDALLDRQAAINDEIASANTQLKLLDSLASGSGIAGQQPPLADLASTLNVLADSGNAARELIRDANRRLRTLGREIAQKQFQLSQVATRQQVQNVLTVSAAVSSAVSTPVAISYPVAQAGWNWLYEARLNTETSFLELHRKAAVYQASGEAWEAVELTVTTGRPGANTDAPDPRSLLVDFQRPKLATAPAVQRSPSFRENAVEEVVVTGSYVRADANVVASRYLVSFEIPGRVSVAPDRQPQMLPIDQRGQQVDLAIRAVPELDPTAYLEAVFVHEDTVPMQAGEVQLYRDGAFIGSTRVDDFLPAEEIRLAFGRDDRIRIEVQRDQAASRDGSTFRRTALDDRRVRYAITSFHPEPVELEVLARIPVPGNADIDVDISNDATPFDVTDLEGNTGVNMWNVVARPNETVELKHYYSISYPQDNVLEFQDRR